MNARTKRVTVGLTPHSFMPGTGATLSRMIEVGPPERQLAEDREVLAPVFVVRSARHRTIRRLVLATRRRRRPQGEEPAVRRGTRAA